MNKKISKVANFCNEQRLDCEAATSTNEGSYSFALTREFLTEICLKFSNGKKILHLSLYLLFTLVNIKKGILETVSILNCIQSQFYEKRIEKRLLTVDELAIYLGCSPKTIRDWVLKDLIPVVRPQPGMVRFDVKIIEEWLLNRRSHI